MKTLNIYAALLLSIFTINFSLAQTAVKTETIKVWGNCGMCKSKIQKSAKSAGATSASWNEETKILNVSYDPSNSNPEKIEKAIAASGYDTQNFKADDKTYNKLMSCCKYERNTAFPNMNQKSNLPQGLVKTGCKSPDACKDKPCYKGGSCDESLCKDIPECKSICCQ